MAAVLTDGATATGIGSAVVLVPAQDPAPPPGRGPEFGNSSPVGLVVVLLLLIATIVLIRSMSRRIRRLPASFDGQDDADSTASGTEERADTPERDRPGQG